jgi:hydroxymethylpyrimidine/phosphomethylpyrimidine kinase
VKKSSPAARPPNLPVALTIAGSDSGAHAGVQADLLTFAALGVYGTTALTCLTAQNPTGISGVHEVPADFVAAQCRQVTDYFRVRAAKTGMLFSTPIIRAVAAFLRELKRVRVVVDPVMVATSGAVLLQPEAIAAVKEDLLPRAHVVTPNLDEAGVLLGRKPENANEVAAAAHELANQYGVPFLVKGGHLPGPDVIDILARPATRPRVWRSRRVPGVDTHGSGCTLSAAITALLARGEPLESAIGSARYYLLKGLKRPLHLNGRAFIAHR